MSPMAAIIFGAWLFAVLLIWRVEAWRSAKGLVERKVSPTVALVLEMLERPNGWSFPGAGYRAIHKTGAAIWIGNTGENAALSLDGDVSPHGMNGQPVIDTTKHERKLLFAAAKRLQSQDVADQHRQKVAEWAALVEQFADNVVKLERRS